MVFRANEAAHDGFQSVKRSFIFRDIPTNQRQKSEDKLSDIVLQYGPVVDSYPSWHPFVSHHNDYGNPATTPESCGYKGLDHTIYFRNALITCPYNDGQEIIDFVERLPYNSVATFTAEHLDVQLWHSSTNPVLVCCNWEKYTHGMIPASLAIPLMLEKETPHWQESKVGETWETMRPYFLGEPHGSRSSLFVNQETALTMKKIWNLLINTGMYGPIFVSNQY